MSISGISQLLLTQCWPNFKGRFKRQSLTDANYYSDICLATFVLVTSVISVISLLLLTRFWWNFKCRFLGTSETDSNCHDDIFPCNIWPGVICLYQEYLSCYWSDFDETLSVASWKHLEQVPTIKLTFVHATFALATIVHIKNILAVTDPILMKL